MTRHDLAALAAILALRAPRGTASQRIAADALKLCRLAKAAESNALALCNGWRNQDAYDRKREILTKSAASVVTPYRLAVRLTGDPRGFCLHLFSTNPNRPLPGNTWGGDEAGYGL